jgi:hypothetical protein
MSKDFANRKTKTGPRKTAKRRSSRRAPAPRGTAIRSAPSPKPGRSKKKPAKGPLFHGPSFSGGIVLGAFLVLAAAYLPEVFRQQVERTLATNVLEDREPVQFEFTERLRRSEVHTDPDTYADDANPRANADLIYIIQAASFQTMSDAESLRAQLLLINLPVQTTPVRVGNRPWYRVTVGPFISQLDAGRAMTRLRELNLDALLTKRVRPER